MGTSIEAVLQPLRTFDTMAEIQIQQSFYFAPFRRRSRAKVTLMRKRSDVLKYAGQQAVQEIEKEIMRSSWKKAPTNLIKSFSYKVRGSRVTVVSTHPGAEFLNRGVKRHQMRTLRQKVPIITSDGKLIFRNLTAKSLANGKWVHPGYQGKHFLRRGMSRARQRIIEVLTDHTISQVARIMGFKR